MSARTLTATPCDRAGTWLVSLHGDHDLATRAELHRRTHAIWQACTVAIVDLSEVAFIDSGVIRWLLAVEREHCHPSREAALTQAPARAIPAAQPPASS
jgi:ABC-type transporter Mla MlaB component